MISTVDQYLALLAGEHRNKPNYVATITAALQPLSDDINVMQSLIAKFDVDVAVGQQLDFIGRWVGASRDLTTPIAGVYFSFNTADVGFNQGVWRGPFDPISGIVSLPDAQYRLLIKAKILNNQWDGSKEEAYRIWDTLFPNGDYILGINDYADLTMGMLLVSNVGPPDAVTYALFTGGYLDLKPAGVQIVDYTVIVNP